ncbi:stimulated by retinoic acid gene 6 protein-like [Glandiceps talaboti]
MEEDVQSIIDALPVGYEYWSLNHLEDYLYRHFNTSSNITQEVIDFISQTSSIGNVVLHKDNVIQDVFFSLLAALSGQHLRKLTVGPTSDIEMNNTVTTTQCDATDRAMFFQAWFLYSLIPSIVLIVVFSFLQKRKRACLDGCHGYLGVAYPMNIIDSSPDRLSYACAFGVTTISILGLYFRNYVLDYEFSESTAVLANGILNIFVKMANILCVAIVYYPIFLSLATKVAFTGNLAGLLYCLSWLTYNVYDFILCSVKETKEELISTLLFDIPNILFFLVLVVRFFVGIFRDIRDFCAKGMERFVVKGEDFRDSHHYLYVKSLLRPQKTIIQESTCRSNFQKVRNHLYQNKPGFRYSTRIVCTMTVAGLVLLQFSTSWNLFVTAFLKDIKDYLGDDKIVLAFELANHSSLHNNLIEFFEVNIVTFNFAHISSVIVHYIVLLLLLASYRRHMLRLFQGDRSSFPKMELTNADVLAYSWKYGGYQVAYILWSWFVMQLTLWICSFIISYFIILPLRDEENNIVLFCLESYWLILILGIFLAYFQVFLAKFVFLQERGDVLGVNNRRWGSVVFFILFYYNMVVGLLSSLLRVLYSALFGLLYLGRTDNSVLMRTYESRDPGFKVYYGFLLTEEYHTHPVLVTFCNFLLESVNDQHNSKYRINLSRGTFRYTQKNVEDHNDNDTSKQEKVIPSAKRKCIRNKWRLVVTLLRNPSLIEYRSWPDEDMEDDEEDEVEEGEEEEKQIEIKDVKTWILKEKEEIDLQDDIWDDLDNAAIATMFADSTEHSVITIGTDNPEESFSDV